MIIESLIFDRPKAVVQIFTNHLNVLKQQWRSGAWRSAVEWNSELRSNTGWAADGVVTLNESILGMREEFAARDIIALIDANNDVYSSSPDNPAVRPAAGNTMVQGVWPVPHVATGYRDPNRRASRYLLTSWPGISLEYGSYDIIRVDNSVELHLVGGRRYLRGPLRGDFKITDLHVGVPVRTILNGIAWPVDEERVYRYGEDIFCYLGEFTRFDIVSRDAIMMQKCVPVGEARVIDLRKEVW